MKSLSLLIVATVCFASFAVQAQHQLAAQNVQFSMSQVGVLQTADYDTGWWPSSGPLQTGFHLTVDGDMALDMKGKVMASWPEAFGVSFLGDSIGGHWVGRYGVLVSAQIKVDAFGLYEGEFDVPYEPDMLQFERELGFDPFLLPGASNRPLELTVSGDKVKLFETQFSLFAGVDVHFRADMTGGMVCQLEGTQIALTEGVAVTLEGGEATLPLPEGYQFSFPATWSGSVSCLANMVLLPIVELCAGAMGCIDLPSIEIPVSFGGDATALEAGPEEISFPLSGLEADAETVDFGQVEVDSKAVFPLTLTNPGGAVLNLEYAIEPADGPFSLFPGELSIAAGAHSGIVVEFLPESLGQKEAVLRVETDSPHQTILEIPLRGTGVGEAVQPTEDVVSEDDVIETDKDAVTGSDISTGSDTSTQDDTETGEDTGGSGTYLPTGSDGCQSGEAPSAVWPILLLLAGLFMARKNERNDRSKVEG